MKTLFLLLQAQAPAQGQPGGGASMWILLLLMFVVMYFFMIRPQRKQQKELEAFQNALKKGDKVIIGNSGIFGEISSARSSRSTTAPPSSAWTATPSSAWRSRSSPATPPTSRSRLLFP